jgi:glycosyltransferase involved in cell wall biosynthesis
MTADPRFISAHDPGVGLTYVDVSAAVHRRAGLGRYAENLARGLAGLIPDRLALFYNRERGIVPLAGLERLPTRTVALGYKPWRMLVWLGQLASVGFNRLVPDAGLFHATEHLLLPLRGVPAVLTVHDLIFRHLPEHHKPLNRWYLNLTMPLYCRRAAHIIAVSEQTRRDVIQAYGVPAGRISVIPEAAAPGFAPAWPSAVEAARARYHLPAHYLLTVGTLEPRKNLVRLLAAWEPLYQAGAAPPLVIAGRRGWLYDSFFAALERSPARGGVVLTDYVDEADLPALYSGADLFIMASLYEGFGLPPLEAMACGLPVVCSNASSLPEIVGEAALLFDPHSVEALADALERALAEPDLRADLRNRGLLRARQFTWDATARQTLAVYQSVAEAWRADRA